MQNLFFCGDSILMNPGTSFPADLPESARVNCIFREKFISFASRSECEVFDIADTSGFEAVPLRTLFEGANADLYGIAQQAYQILNWRRSYRFCPRCGLKLERKNGGERAMRCEKCGTDYFPRINPAVIMGVEYGDSILLAERRGRNGVFYSVLAGFVEPGETLEGAVAREVMEEVGIKVTDIKYLKSQAWPFPNNIMLAFSARALSPEIMPDGVEITNARWFKKDSLPVNLPRKASVANWIISRFVKNTVATH